MSHLTDISSVKPVEWIFDGQHPVVISGAGRMGRSFLRELRRVGVEPVAFSDRDHKKFHTHIDGIEILPTPEVMAVYGTVHPVMLVASLLGEFEITRHLRECEFANIYPLSTLHRARPDVFHMVHMDGLWDTPAPPLDLWADPTSVRTYDGILDYRRSASTDVYHRLMAKETQYFPPDILTLTHADVILDAGAFTGDTLATMRRIYPDIAPAYVAFEPDPINFRALTQAAADYPGTFVAVQAGLGESEGTLSFEPSAAGDAHFAPSGSITVPVHTIDRFFADRAPPTFIKMDIEGMEPAALRGAAETIRKHAPKLAIAVYHAPDHVWEIPFYVKELRPDYRFYLRHYTTNLTDSVMYAVR